MVAKRRVADALKEENQNVSKLVTPEMIKVQLVYMYVVYLDKILLLYIFSLIMYFVFLYFRLCKEQILATALHWRRSRWLRGR